MKKGVGEGVEGGMGVEVAGWVCGKEPSYF